MRRANLDAFCSQQNIFSKIKKLDIRQKPQWTRVSEKRTFLKLWIILSKPLKALTHKHFKRWTLKARCSKAFKRIYNKKTTRKFFKKIVIHLFHIFHYTSECNKTFTPFFKRKFTHCSSIYFNIAVII